MKRTVLLVLSLVFACLLFASGCNTVRGMGKDLEQGGKQLQDLSTR